MALDNPSYFTMANPPPLCSLSSSISSTSSKRSQRSLLRSLSTNSTDSNHELLNSGAPRLSDIAPEFQTTAEPRRANSLKASTSRHRDDGLYSPLPTHDVDVIDHVEDEVFLAQEDARYYNLRRHSISALRPSQPSISDLPSAIVHATLDGQSATSSLASRINVQIDDHKLRHGSYPRKRCNRCPRGIVKRADMEDILIVSAKDSEPANLWAQYFASYFEQLSQNANRKPYRIRHLGIEEIIAKNGDIFLIAERISCVKLQLVILCPLFLEKISEHSQASVAGLPTLLLPDRILALQLGTSDSDIGDVQKSALPAFQQWQRRPVGQDQDQNFAQEFVSTAIGIFTKIWKQQSSIASEENSQFSIAPKKIRHGHTSVLVLLEYPLHNEDIVKISVVKNEEMTEMKNVKRRNPYTLKFTIPERFLDVSAIVNILVEKNGSFIGKRPIKCESRLRELEQILRSTNNPVEFMCQSLGFSPHDTEQLDNWLVHMFQKNSPPNFSVFATTNPPMSGPKHECKVFPTLLHFAANFGLEKLTAQLLDCPGGDIACEMRNIQDFTPADIAESVGHKEINNMLRGYMKMNELAVVYTKIKKLTIESDFLRPPESSDLLKIEEAEEHYLSPEKVENVAVEEFYKLCPAPKPIAFNLSQSAPSTPITEEEPTLTQYISMDQQKFETSTHYQNMPASEPEVKSSIKMVLEPLKFEPKDGHGKKPRLHSSMQSIVSKNSNTSKDSSSFAEDKVQVELAEIINDFKNNVHTIAQTEQLVAEWQNRNDVQKSFREKQDQLKEMRVRYEKIQKELKHNGKKTSPFERFKKIFGWSGQHQSVENASNDKQCVSKDECEGKLPLNGESQAGRPISSLSLQSTASSSSSGRMSTISGCSLGDSGTHSDHDERKIILGSPNEEFKSQTSPNTVHNYVIPPTPRPIKSHLMMYQSFPTIEERTGRENLDSFYIQFPPNGLPVDAGFDVNESKTLTEMKKASHEESCNKTETSFDALLQTQSYMNLPLDNVAGHDYMNFKSMS